MKKLYKKAGHESRFCTIHAELGVAEERDQKLVVLPRKEEGLLRVCPFALLLATASAAVLLGLDELRVQLRQRGGADLRGLAYFDDSNLDVANPRNSKEFEDQKA